MDFIVSFAREKVGGSPSGVADYVHQHLMSPREIGCLALVERARDRAGFIAPYLHNYPLWCAVGHDPETPQLSRRLIQYLCMGMDFYGDQLTQTELFRPPVEVLLTVSSELSEAMAPHPEAAYSAMFSATKAFCHEVDKAAVSVRVGGRESEFRFGHTLTAAYLHAENEAGEPQLHAHVKIFTPVRAGFATWLAFNCRALSRDLHESGGAREIFTQAFIARAAEFRFRSDYLPGRASHDRPHGVRVYCPSGLVIEPGSIPRLRSAEVCAQRAIGTALGAPALTPQELALVLRQAGQYPVAGAGGQRQDRFEGKLRTLELLDPEGRIISDLLVGLSALDFRLSIVEASLRDLPFQESMTAAQLVRARREGLHDQVPAIRTDDWAAHHAWITAYEELLASVENKAVDWAALPRDVQETMQLIERAGVVQKHYEDGLLRYHLTSKGEARRQLGLREAAEIVAAIPELFAHVSTNQPPADVALSRLWLAGVQVAGTQLQLRRLGRVVDAAEQIRGVGITPSTLPSIPDLSWWQWYWDHRYELPPILAQLVLHPEELPEHRRKGRRESPYPNTLDLPSADLDPPLGEEAWGGLRSQPSPPPWERGGPALSRPIDGRAPGGKPNEIPESTGGKEHVRRR